MLCLFVFSLIAGLFIIEWFYSQFRLNNLKTEEVQKYFYQQVPKGSTKQRVEYWLYCNSLKADCSESDMIFVRVQTKPETLLMIQFDREGKFVYCEGYPYQGSCPPPPIE